jgi:hypothetical protein
MMAASAVFIAASVASSIDYCTCCNNVVASTMAWAAAQDNGTRAAVVVYDSAVDGVGKQRYGMAWASGAILVIV